MVTGLGLKNEATLRAYSTAGYLHVVADDRTRPSWWPRWIPARCEAGHPLLPGTVAIHYVNHPGCPANTDGRGHDLWSCETDGCGAEMRPEECTDPRPTRPPRSHRRRP